MACEAATHRAAEGPGPKKKVPGTPPLPARISKSREFRHTTGPAPTLETFLRFYHEATITTISPTQHNMAEQKSLAKDLFEDMGRKVAEASAQQEEDDSRVVDEIESMCMNCHDNVRLSIVVDEGAI